MLNVPTHMTLAVSVPTHFMSSGLAVGMLTFYKTKSSAFNIQLLF
jgi:hypothetical protein